MKYLLDTNVISELVAKQPSSKVIGIASSSANVSASGSTANSSANTWRQLSNYASAAARCPRRANRVIN
jgi:predicted nucleic acid-binding protein